LRISITGLLSYRIKPFSGVGFPEIRLGWCSHCVKPTLAEKKNCRFSLILEIHSHVPRKMIICGCFVGLFWFLGTSIRREETMRVPDKVALVTGGGQGLGETISLALAREGAHVAIGDVNLDRAERVVGLIEEEGRKAIALRADVSSESEIKALVAQSVAGLGTIDILVNNAGIFHGGPIAEMSEDIWDRVLDVNLKGTFLCSREIIPLFKEKGRGKVINIASLAGQVGGILAGANYATSKAGVICFTKSLAKELAPFGVNVNCIAPGVIDTEMTEAFPREELKKSIPLGTLGEPQDIANAVLFFASEESKYITGETLNVNGGVLMD
jgi:3-oxoacyl-[acyl-carrier protein] reductase